MKIIVCMKQVPATTKVDIDPEHSSLLNFRVYADRKGQVTHDDLKDPFGALQ